MEYYTIGKLSKLTHISPDALRYYDEIGLLKPAHIDRDSGYRYYTDSCAAVLAQIAELKEFGFSLSEIKTLLSAEQNLDKIYNHRHDALLKQRKQLDAAIGKLGARIRNLKEEEKMDKNKKCRVLLVDDARIMLMMLDDIFTKHGFEVLGRGASSGTEGVAMYKELRPDLVVMNNIMPEKTGTEATKEILEFDPDAKIIMCSAMSKPQMVLDTLLAGAKGFVAKPFVPQKLVEKAEEVLASKFALNKISLAKLREKCGDEGILGQDDIDEIIRLAQDEKPDLSWFVEILEKSALEGIVNEALSSAQGQKEMAQMQADISEIKEILRELVKKIEQRDGC